MKWRTTRLGTIAEFRNGLNYNSRNFGNGIKVINVLPRLMSGEVAV